MADATVSRIGDINAGGTDPLQLFLKVFGGEVLTAFRQATKFLPYHMVRSIASGKSAQFPAMGRASAAYHTPGAELTGQTINHAERIISIDGKLVADVFVDELDEAMNHYEIRGEYAYQLGNALAQEFDQNVARVMGMAARSSATVTGLSGGTTIEASSADTDADVLAGAIFDAAQAFDEKYVPDADRVSFTTPANYYNMVENGTKTIHRDYFGEGSYASGRIIRVAGIPIIKTNNLPTTDESVAGGSPPKLTKYADDFSTTQALVTHRSSVGTVKLINLATRSDWDPRRLGTLLTARYAIGHGILRPESAVEIRTSQPVNASA